MYRITTYIFLSIVAFSCEKLIEDLPNSKLPNTEPKLVIFSIISPQDTLVSVFVTLSKPIFSPVDTAILEAYVVNGDTLYFKEKGLQNARVNISNGSANLELKYNEKENKYAAVNDPANSFFKEGETYNLTVEVNGLKATASTQIPVGIPDVSILDFRIKKTNNFSDNYESTIKIKINDTGDPLNYAVFASNISIDSIADNDVICQNLGNCVLLVDNRIFFNDFRIFSGKDYKLPKEINGQGFFRNYSQRSSSQEPFIRSLIVEARKTDQNYYEFEKYRRSNRVENPFTEPTPLYSNISNGLGIFASYTANRVEIKGKNGKISLLQ